MSKKSEAKAIAKIYEERTKFIVIGLTGRTGSGCSTVAEILTEDIKTVKLPRPKQSDFDSNEERKYAIIYNYISKNWKEFYKIAVTDIITLFILEKEVDKFMNYIREEFKDYIVHNNNHDFSEEFKELYKAIREERNHYRKILKKISKEEKEEAVTNINLCYEFYFGKLPEFTKKVKKAINNKLPDLGYTKIYQIIGDNIRSSGEAFQNQFNPNNVYTLAQIINKFIKLIKRKAIIENKSTMVVIDALRNPFEAFFFKDRYSAFYLVSVNAPDDVRKERLREHRKLNEQQIKSLDEKEYPKKLKSTDVFKSQNVQKCIEISDIHLTNPKLGNHDKSELKKQIAHYLTLIIHPGLVTPTPVERCMQIAYAAKLNSGCISRQVGAVITDKNYSIKAVGWNDTASGQVPCLLRSVENLIRNEDKQAFSDYEKNNNDFQKFIQDNYNNAIDNKTEEIKCRNISFCFKDIQNHLDGEKNQVHTRSLHAEENAFLQISKYGGEGIENGVLFTTACPCELCAKKAYQLGIKKIVYIDPYPGIALPHIINSGTKRPELKLFHGAIGKAYHQLYQPILPFKDELSMLIDTSYYMYKSLEENLKKIEENIEKYSTEYIEVLEENIEKYSTEYIEVLNQNIQFLEEKKQLLKRKLKEKEGSTLMYWI